MKGGTQSLAGVSPLSAKITVFAGTLSLVLGLDLATKLLVQGTFHLYESVEVVGDLFRLTYIYNPGAAFGLHLGPHSRFIFLGLALVALAVLIAMYRNTPAEERLRLFAIGAIAGGALGNVIDRIRSPHGVVDFLDFGIGHVRWPVFNIADTAVTIGAVMLLISLWAEDRRRAREQDRSG